MKRHEKFRVDKTEPKAVQISQACSLGVPSTKNPPIEQLQALFSLTGHGLPHFLPGNYKAFDGIHAATFVTVGGGERVSPSPPNDATTGNKELNN